MKERGAVKLLSRILSFLNVKLPTISRRKKNYTCMQEWYTNYVLRL